MDELEKLLKEYLEAILKQYMAIENGVIIHERITSSDGTWLSATERLSDSKIGIVIIPGLTVPRESYYPLLAALSKFNVFLFDIRGQGSSDGELDSDLCKKDINFVGAQFKERNSLDYLIGIGHSFGGMMLLEASLEPYHPYDLRISLAAPVDITKAASRIPEWGSSFAAYVYNIKRRIQRPVYRDRVVRHHQSLNPLVFLQDPRIIALKVNSPKTFNSTRLKTLKLTDYIGAVRLPSYFVYPGEDEILGIHGMLNGDYKILSQKADAVGFDFSILEGLSHRFNIQPEKQFMFSYNNDRVMGKIIDIIHGEAPR